MRVIITGPAVAKNADTDKPIADAKTLASLDGLVYEEDNCVEYFDGKLEQLNLAGGKVGLRYDKAAKQLQVVTEYISGKALKPGEIKLLIAATEGQWSDGIGEGSFWSEVKPSITVDLYPMDRGKDATQVEQIDDGSKPPPRPRISPLFKAVEDKDLAKVEKLLEKGEDPSAFDIKKGRSILHVAVSRLPAAAKLLIESGADIHRKTKASSSTISVGATPLLECVKSVVGQTPEGRKGGRSPVCYSSAARTSIPSTPKAGHRFTGWRSANPAKPISSASFWTAVPIPTSARPTKATSVRRR